MKNKIWMSLIILVIAIITISCQSETENNTASSEISINDDVEDNSEQDFKDDSEEAFEDEPAYTTDEYFIKEHSVYRNPIDQYFWSKLNPKDKSETEYRRAQADYQKAWKAEYQNLMKWMKKKCVYNEDKNNLRLLEKSVAEQNDREKKILESYLTAAGADHLTQIEGELYRDLCMRILAIAGYENYNFKFHKSGNGLIDQSFLPKLNSWGKSQAEYRKAQRDYQKAWKAEYQNLMKWMKKSVLIMRTRTILVY